MHIADKTSDKIKYILKNLKKQLQLHTNIHQSNNSHPIYTYIHTNTAKLYKT